MILRGGRGNFFAAHYDWLAAGAGVLALAAAAVYFALALGEDPDEAAAVEQARIDRMKPAETGVKPIDLADYQLATRLTRSPVTVAEVSSTAESFLASERRVKCKCGRVISGDVKAFPKCPFCGAAQEAEKAVVFDTDGDGLPDEWEKKYGLNPNSAKDAEYDKDGDGFTNLEEYQAKTDPTDRRDHPPYLDSLSITLPLKETYMPFSFVKATQIPGGWRLGFFDSKRTDNFGRRGAVLTARIGEEIADTGYVVKAYEPKTEKRERKGMKGMMVPVDVSETLVERKSDGKVVKLVVQTGKGLKPVPVDVQATLTYERGETKTFVVVPGSTVDLNGEKYKVTDVAPVGDGARVTLENVLSGMKRTITAP